MLEVKASITTSLSKTLGEEQSTYNLTKMAFVANPHCLLIEQLVKGAGMVKWKRPSFGKSHKIEVPEDNKR
jgi:hypothetical protein